MARRRSGVARTTTAEPDYSEAAPGATFTLAKVSGTWPGVPTARADLVFIWKGPDPSPATVSSRTVGSAGMLNGVDMRLVTT